MVSCSGLGQPQARPGCSELCPVGVWYLPGWRLRSLPRQPAPGRKVFPDTQPWASCFHYACCLVSSHRVPLRRAGLPGLSSLPMGGCRRLLRALPGLSKPCSLGYSSALTILGPPLNSARLVHVFPVLVDPKGDTVPWWGLTSAEQRAIVTLLDFWAAQAAADPLCCGPKPSLLRPTTHRAFPMPTQVQNKKVKANWCSTAHVEQHHLHTWVRWRPCPEEGRAGWASKWKTNTWGKLEPQTPAQGAKSDASDWCMKVDPTK